MRRVRSIRKGSLFLKGILLFSYYVVTISWLKQISYTLYLVFNTYRAYLAYVDTYNRGRIVDDVDSSTEFYIDSHVSMSDGEDA